MYYMFNIMLTVNMLILDVHGIKFFSFHNSHRRLTKLRSAAVLTSAPILTEWINQKLDHFDPQETRTWKMRYFKRLDYCTQNGPIYFIIGGESTAHPGDLAAGLINEMAKETKGALYISEHRYYGESQPLNKRNIEAMKYLTTEQALADNARLIKKIKKSLNFKRSKVIVIGASYAGNLATWMKLIYPNLVDAVIASSAPVLAKRDFYESLEIIYNDYEKYGSADCITNIRSLFQRYDSLFQTKEGIRQLKQEENICDEVDLTNPDNKIVFFIAKIDPFVNFAQDGNVIDIKNHCDKINGTHNMVNELNALGDTEEYWFKKGNCNDYDFNRMIQTFRKDINELSWIYQTCTEYGYFFSTTSDNQPFTKNLPVEFSDKVCTALFGASFNKQRVIDGVRKINQMYGGRSPNVSQVVFVNGELDPWSSLSVSGDISPEAPAIYIPKANHCSDLVFEENEPEEVKKVRTRIKYLIKKWISDRKPSSFKFNLTISICRHC